MQAHQTKLFRSSFVAGLTLLSLLFSASAFCLEFKSVEVPKAILFDAPSTEAKKIYILGAGYPVEVIVNLGEWIKVRDHLGALSWIQGKQLSSKRTALVLADKVEVRQTEDDTAALLATIEKDVVIEIVPASTKGGWLKIKHKDGISGYIHATDVWGQ